MKTVENTGNNRTADAFGALSFSPTLLTAATIAHIRRWSNDAEINGCLHPEQLAIAHQQRWFHLFVPKNYDGLEMPLPEAVRLEEEIAFADGSMGWVVTLCAGAAMFVGYFEEDMANVIFSKGEVIIAGSGQVGGTASATADGYLVNGRWPYASGAPHAQWLTGNCRVQGNGNEHTMSFIFERREVLLDANWHYVGLNASAGHSFEVRDVFVPRTRAFMISAESAVMPGNIYRYPFLQLAEATLAANTSGMCLYFLELAAKNVWEKQPSHERGLRVREKGKTLILDAAAHIAGLRREFFDALDDSWNQFEPDNQKAHLLNRVSTSSRRLARIARNLVNEIYPYCGLEAARTETPIGRVWRNINTASQHSLLLEVD